MKTKIVLIILVSFMLTFFLCYNFCNYKYTFKVNEDRKFYGKKVIENSSIIVCGLIRDGENNIEHIKQNVYSLIEGCKKYKILIVENDSIDNTRKILLKWSEIDNNVIILGCGVNIDKCEMKLDKTVVYDHGMKRINKMVYLRNIYLEYIYNHLTDYDYTIVYDYDLYGTIYKDGLYDTFYHFINNNNIDCIGPNGFKYYNFIMLTIKHYYDTYAFVIDNITNYKDLIDDDIKRKYINKLLSTLSLKKVSSCFGGIIIYKNKSIKNKYYNTTNIFGHALCEHAGLNFQLSNVYINPVFEYNIYYNPY